MLDYDIGTISCISEVYGSRTGELRLLLRGPVERISKHALTGTSRWKCIAPGANSLRFDGRKRGTVTLSQYESYTPHCYTITEQEGDRFIDAASRGESWNDPSSTLAPS